MALRTLSSRLKDRVTIQEKDLIDNGKGGRKPRDPAALWKDLARDVAAEVKALRGDEALREGVERSVRLWRVEIRARKGLTTAMQILWDDPIFGPVEMNIRVMAPNDARDGIVMTCESGVPS